MESFLNTEYIDLLTGRQLLVIIHLFGLALGAGAAFVSDFTFVQALKDRTFTRHELNMLELLSKIVWLGLGVLVLSGGLIFLGYSELLFNSSKFLAKITVVGVIIINGLLFKFVHMPKLNQLVDKDISKLKNPRLRGMFISGGLSGVSWATALTLGVLREVEYSYWQIIGVYGLVAVGAMCGGLGLNWYFTKNQ